MKIYSQKYIQTIPAELNTVWDFFSSPANLSKITPAKMNFRILHITGGEKMYDGQLISYKVSPFPFIRTRWTTEIKSVQQHKHFIDEQKFGPFSLWYHQHFFEQTANGVLMTDDVSYAIPLGILGRMVNSILVKKQVENIFAFRKKAIEEIFKH